MTGFEGLLGAMSVSTRVFALRSVGASGPGACPIADQPTALYVLDGSGRILIQGQPVEALGPDDFLVLPRGAACRIETGSRVVVAQGPVIATFGGAAGPFDGLRTPLATRFADRPMRESFLALVDELAAPGPGSRTIAECILKQALVRLMREQFAEAREAALPWVVAVRDDRLGRAVRAMLERPSDPLTLDALARLAGMSRSAFAERFNAAFGQSPIDFLRDIRLGRAARLLASTDLPVKRIANAVGYESRSYFSRAFRSRYDVDPSDYRVNRPDAA